MLFENLVDVKRLPIKCNCPASAIERVNRPSTIRVQFLELIVEYAKVWQYSPWFAVEEQQFRLRREEPRVEMRNSSKRRSQLA